MLVGDLVYLLQSRCSPDDELYIGFSTSLDKPPFEVPLALGFCALNPSENHDGDGWVLTLPWDVIAKIRKTT